MLIFTAVLAGLPFAPHAEGFQLVVQMGFAESLFDFGVMEAGARRRSSVGQANGQGTGLHHMFFQFGRDRLCPECLT